MPVRAFTEEDIPEVADLYWTVSRARRGKAPIELQASMQELYFKNPWLDGSQPSLVFDDHTKIIGFLGVVRRKMSSGEQSLVAAFGGNFAVYPDSRSTLAALHLLRAYMLAGQDVSLVDSANDTSRALLERFGFSTIIPFSVHWIRVLRPAHFATYAASHLARNAVVNAMAFAARPVCGVVDRLASSLSASPFRRSDSPLYGAELEVETLLACHKEFRNGYSLWPEYDADSLSWLLNFMARTKAYGHDLRKVVLHDSAGRLAGWYIYAARAGGIGEVVQIRGYQRNIKNILDHLFRDAWDKGVVALRGIMDWRWMPAFSERNCWFTCRGGWMVAHSHNPGFIAMLSDDGACWSRLDGEWCLALGA